MSTCVPDIAVKVSVGAVKLLVYTSLPTIRKSRIRVSFKYALAVPLQCRPIAQALVLAIPSAAVLLTVASN